MRHREESYGEEKVFEKIKERVFFYKNGCRNFQKLHEKQILQGGTTICVPLALKQK